MKKYIILLIFIFLSACSDGSENQLKQKEDSIISVSTSINPKLCKKSADKDDPNNTPFYICSGAFGYQLIIKQTDAGRQTINIIDKNKKISPLKINDIISSGFFHFGDKVEWIALDNGNTKEFLLLSIRILLHDNVADPEKVTSSSLALINKIKNKLCITKLLTEKTALPIKKDKLIGLAKGEQCLIIM